MVSRLPQRIQAGVLCMLLVLLWTPVLPLHDCAHDQASASHGSGAELGSEEGCAICEMVVPAFTVAAVQHYRSVDHPLTTLATWRPNAPVAEVMLPGPARGPPQQGYGIL